MRFLLLFSIVCYATYAQAQFKLEGVIYDDRSSQLANANVVISGTKYATISDDLGKFTFESLPEATYILRISYVGFQTKKISIDLQSNANLRIDMVEEIFMTDDVIVSGIRARDLSPTTFKNISKPEIERKNLGQDIPILLEHTPSVVSTSDAGAGVGYTGIRMRGTDPSRINVTLNGIPLNDSESQGVFWVNLPDFATSVKSIQIQRGVGTSTNGAGAFGGSINMLTTSLSKKPYAELSNSAGSFKTFRHSLSFGTGLIRDRFSLDGRLSKISSDGYIDRATSDLKSYFLSASYYDHNTIIRANVFSGKEVTYQAWYGVYEGDLDTNRTFNVAGTDFFAKAEPYDNEVDDYKQDHYQLLLTQQIANGLTFNTGFHYTKGQGFFEQYKVGQSLEAYNLSPVILHSDTISSTDLIRQRWLDNDFYGVTFSLNFNRIDRLNTTLGGAWNQYDGDHFGEIKWAEFASNGQINHRFYDNSGLKTDFNIYLKANYQFQSKLSTYLDLQYRNIGYSVSGIDIDQRNLFVDDDLHFFNPKLGLAYRIGTSGSIYASFGIGNKEPSRNDYIDVPDLAFPRPEKLRNLELGLRLGTEHRRIAVNYYLMDYKDQLVLSGELNDVGTPVRTNVDKSYRTGIELDGSILFIEKLKISANATVSMNKISNFTEVINTYDETYTAIPSLAIINQYDQTDIAFSPGIIASAIIAYEPIEGLKLDLLNKYAGKQFLDNTSNDDRRLDAYIINDLLLSYTFDSDFIREISVSLLLNNLTNRLYESNGYTFSERYTDSETAPTYLTDPVTYNYYYPQAGFNVLAGLTLKF